MKLGYEEIEDNYDDTTKIRTMTEQAVVKGKGLLLRSRGCVSTKDGAIGCAWAVTSCEPSTCPVFLRACSGDVVLDPVERQGQPDGNGHTRAAPGEGGADRYALRVGGDGRPIGGHRRDVGLMLSPHGPPASSAATLVDGNRSQPCREPGITSKPPGTIEWE